MLNWDKTAVEALLEELDEKNYLFPEFKLHKVNNQLHLLGKGGFSVIYEMRGRDNSFAEYVVKVIGLEKHSMTSEQFQNTVNIQRFLSEQSPYVMRIIDAKEIKVIFEDTGKIKKIESGMDEETEENELFLQLILMEKLENVIVKDRFKKVELINEHLKTENDVIEFAMQIGHVLQTAHSNDILHRDIKLENIFWDKNEDCFKLGDFGIAKYVEGGNADTVVYTEGYGAPEIGRRLRESYDATADIYSFGITLYLLLNDLKFPGSDGYYSSKVQYDPQFIFPAPQNASETMTRIIRKMCNYHKEDRYQSVAEVLRDLKSFSNMRNVEDDSEAGEVCEIPTETYREEPVAKSRVNKDSKKNEHFRKEEDLKILKKAHQYIGIFYWSVLTLLIPLFLFGIQKDIDFVGSWVFWMLPGILLLEWILIRIKEFHILFGCVCLVGIVYSMFVLGVSVPQVVLLFSLLIGIPAVSLAGISATIIWSLIVYVDKTGWFAFVAQYHLTWIVFGIIVLALGRYIYCYVAYKTWKKQVKNDCELDK